MDTQRITVSTLFTLAVSAFVCLLAVEALPQQSAQAGNAQRSAQTASQESEASDVGLHMVVDRKPLEDFFGSVGRTIKGSGLDLSSPVSLRIEADRGEDGTLTNVSITQASGDRRIQNLASDFTSALSSSRVLSALQGAEHVSITLNLTDSSFASALLFKARSPERASSMVRGYNEIFHFGGVVKPGTNQAVILSHISATANDENVAITLAMPRETLNALLSRMLAEY